MIGMAMTAVAIAASAFAPPHVSVLAGDTVNWQNNDFRQHTVTARDGSFFSGRLSQGSSYSFKFSALGAHPYYCQIHPFMTGEVDVYPVLLSGPKDATPGSQISLSGRTEAGTSGVQIEQDTGSGFSPVSIAAVDGSGEFHASVTATTTARYRAMSAAGSSDMVQVVVTDRNVTVAASRRGLVRVKVTPSDPGAPVTLQIWKRERFGWWPVARRKLDKSSRAVFHAPRGARVRAVLTLPDGWTPLATSPALRVRR